MKRYFMIGILAWCAMIPSPYYWSSQGKPNKLIRPILVPDLVENAMIPTNQYVFNMRVGALIEFDVFVSSPPYPEVKFNFDNSAVVERATPFKLQIYDYGMDSAWEYGYFIRAVKKGNCTITLEVDGQPITYQFFVADDQ